MARKGQVQIGWLECPLMECHLQALDRHRWWCQGCILKWWEGMVDYLHLLCRACIKCREVCSLWWVVCHPCPHLLLQAHKGTHILVFKDSPSREGVQVAQIQEPRLCQRLIQNNTKIFSRTTWNFTKTCQSKWLNTRSSSRSKSNRANPSNQKRTRCSRTFSRRTLDLNR